MTERSEIKDIDGNVYASVQIGEYLWLNKNLSVTRFNCGTKINRANSFEEWDNFLTKNLPAYCFYDFDEKNKESFGLLYNIHVLEFEEGHFKYEIAPEDWQVPNHYLIEELIKGIGVKECGEYIKSKDMWNLSPHNNQSGMNIVPSGYLDGFVEEFQGKGEYARFGMLGGYFMFTVDDNNNFININKFGHSHGFSLRCAKRANCASEPIVKKTFEITARDQAHLEFFNGLKCFEPSKSNVLFDLIAIILIVTPGDIRNTYIDNYAKACVKPPFNDLTIDINKRISLIIENQLDNNEIFIRLAEFNIELSEFEAVFIAAYISHYIFPAFMIKRFDIQDSNNFLMVLTVVDKVKKYYLKNEFPLFIDNKGVNYLKEIISLMSI